MPLMGARGGGSVRGFGRFGAGKPNAPTINSVTIASTTSVTIAYTLGSNNGAPISTIGFVSSPSIALTYTNTDLDGSILVTGSFASNTNYTFTMTATNAVGTSDASPASSSVNPNPAYALIATITNSQTWTVPSGITQLAAVVYAGGAGGSGGQSGGYFNQGIPGAGGGGGVSSKVAGFKDVSTSPGTNYSLTIGAGGNAGTGNNTSVSNRGGNAGSSSFGTLLTVNGPTGPWGTSGLQNNWGWSEGSFFGNISYNTAAGNTYLGNNNVSYQNHPLVDGNNALARGGEGGIGSNGAGARVVNTTMGITLPLETNYAYNVGTSGGGGSGARQNLATNLQGISNNGAGSGGTGGAPQSAGGNATAPTNYGSGGGGGGGGGAGSGTNNAPINTKGGDGSAGRQGVIYIYGK
jgi:hypothetical protein